MLGEKVDGSLVVQRACHDAPRNRVTDLRGEVLQSFRLQLEQALVAGQPDVEHSLGSFKTQARTLSACNEECCDLTFSE